MLQSNDQVSKYKSKHNYHRRFLPTGQEYRRSFLHKYLRTIGFSEMKRQKQLRELIRDVVEHFDEKQTVEKHGDGIFAEFTRYYAGDCGLSVCGQFEEDGQFHVEYCYPLMRGEKVTTENLPVTIERHTDKESFAGACDDLRIGVTLIFFLQNPAKHMLRHPDEDLQTKEVTEEKPLILTALAREGTILLPLEKDKEAVKVEKELSKNRSDLLAAAMDGDEDAMESLTMEEMDTYSMISERIVKDDVFTIVDSYFMPYGIECDQYNIMGEIQDMETLKNEMTGERILKMTLDCNDLTIQVGINEKDLLGEPAIGRRFKGVVWLQGRLQ